MSTKIAWRNAALMIVFGAAGLTQFSENVRAVQILGLLASGALFGVSLSTIFMALRANRDKA